MSETLYLLTICLPLATILAVFALRSFTAVQKARAEAGGSATQAALQRITATLDDVTRRVAAIETMLKEVG